MQDPTSPILHIILTRFNLPTGGRESKLRQGETWLEHRFDLFETICLPSVMAQTSQSFVWFIFFDKDTPEPFRERAIRLSNAYQNIKTFWRKRAPLTFITDEITKCVTKDHRVLITTRLDNDDALNKRFIELIQKTQQQISDTEKTIINFDNGITFYNGKTYKHKDKSNAFASLIEPLDDRLDTVWKNQHTELHKIANIMNLDHKDMWLQMIHGKNVSNRVRGYRINNAIIEQNFKTKAQQLANESDWGIRLENITLSPMRNVKEWCRYAIKKAYLQAQSLMRNAEQK